MPADLKSLGYDPKKHFLDEDPARPDPLVVEHATGHPVAAVVDGEAVPYADYTRDRPKAPAPPASFRAEGSGLSLGLTQS